MKIGFVESLKEVAKGMPYLTQILMGIVILSVIVGVTIYQVGSGIIDVPTAVLTFINTTIGTNLVTIATTVLTAIGVIMALLVVVVIIVLFRRFLGGEGKGGART